MNSHKTVNCNNSTQPSRISLPQFHNFLSVLPTDNMRRFGHQPASHLPYPRQHRQPELLIMHQIQLVPVRIMAMSENMAWNEHNQDGHRCYWLEISRLLLQSGLHRIHMHHSRLSIIPPKLSVE